MSESHDAELQRIAVIGDYLPRKCGIATFTANLCDALAAQLGDDACFVVSVNDTAEGYEYPPRVRSEFFETDVDSYRRAADFLNHNNVDLACLQHEYNIYGGVSGEYIVELLRALTMPVVTTLHTTLQSPSATQRRVLQEIARLSDRVVTLTQRGAVFLRDIYGVPAGKIDVIPHGIPDVPFVEPAIYKEELGLKDKLVLLTFGLLSPVKGLEHVIEALPEIVARHPNVVYVVLGATHPHIVSRDGESYRRSLQGLARDRGVESHVIWHDQFVSFKELTEHLGAADVYITPYLDREQIVSGTLAYAVGAGKAVVSTPYWHAEELLADDRGVLFPFRDSRALATQVIRLLDNEAERHELRKRAYAHGRRAIWSSVARCYIETFKRARAGRAQAIQH